MRIFVYLDQLLSLSCRSSGLLYPAYAAGTSLVSHAALISVFRPQFWRTTDTRTRGEVKVLRLGLCLSETNYSVCIQWERPSIVRRMRYTRCFIFSSSCHPYYYERWVVVLSPLLTRFAVFESAQLLSPRVLSQSAEIPECVTQRCIGLECRNRTNCVGRPQVSDSMVHRNAAEYMYTSSD